MPTIRFRNRDIPLKENQAVLEGLLENGFAIPNSCRAGVCGACLLRSSAGAVPARAQAGMKESWKALGYFYSCVCVPESDLTVDSADANMRHPAEITALTHLSDDVIRVHLSLSDPFEFRSGQYITVFRDTVARSYSIASLPEHGEIELHIRKIPGGLMSGWFHDEARVGDQVVVVGPAGECFYTEGREEQPLILVGTGTGLAPLYGILRDALQKNHRGKIHLFHGALHRPGLYLVDELRELANEHPNFTYTPAVLRGDEKDGLHVGAIDQVIQHHYRNLSGWRGFVCGDPAIVQTLKKKLFLAGIASREIFADAFLPSAVR